MRPKQLLIGDRFSLFAAEQLELFDTVPLRCYLLLLLMNRGFPDRVAARELALLITAIKKRLT